MSRYSSFFKKLGTSFAATGACACALLLAAGCTASRQAPAAEQGTADATAEMFRVRQHSVVAVEGIIRNEIDRDVARGLGLVIDTEGRIVLQDGFLPGWLPPSRFSDFKVKLPGEEGDGAPAVYLGQDYMTGWHYVQVRDKERWPQYRPITDFGKAEPQIGEALWGIGIRNESWDYLPYFLSGRMSSRVALPWWISFSDQQVASPGSVVFDAQGRFAGWATAASTVDVVMYSQNQRRRVGLQPIYESDSFIAADTFYEFFNRVPKSVEGDSRPWLGVNGIQPLDREVAEVMGLKGRGALVVSDVIKGSPAEAGGLQGRDIIVGLNGEPLPRMQPSFVLPQWLEFKLLEQPIGGTVVFDVVRGGGASQPVSVTLTGDPKTLKQAERVYFPRLGLGVREFTLYDGIDKLVMAPTAPGVIADFIRPNGAVDSGGLEGGDWILSIDGTDVADFAAARELLAPIEGDATREEIVLLVKRNNETKVLRIKLH